MHTTYTGRFAPSPSGPLHMGSLVAALGSYLQARHHNGRWFVRIEDIDPPREVVGSDTAILRTLEAHGLHWDGNVVYQSTRHGAYGAAIDTLERQGRCYKCVCTRKQIKAIGGHYPGTCRHKQHQGEGLALRFYNDTPATVFTDTLQGEVHSNNSGEDFIIKRKDGLFAYQLAVVVDDIAQGITEIVRGADLLEPTFMQLALYATFDVPAPSYLHLPIIVSAPGNKLSKQNHAPEVNNACAVDNLKQALSYLRLDAPAERDSVESVLDWALENWSVDTLPKHKEIILAGDA